MNSIRALLLSLSRITPKVMLLIIMGSACVVTIMVTGKMNENIRQAAEEKKALEAVYNRQATVVCTSKDIPEGSTIAADALKEKKVNAGRVPISALGALTMAVGRVAKHRIPAGQIVTAYDLLQAPQ